MTTGGKRVTTKIKNKQVVIKSDEYFVLTFLYMLPSSPSRTKA